MEAISRVHELEMLERAASFDPHRMTRDERQLQAIIAELFMILGARAIVADRLIGAVPSDDDKNFKDYKKLLNYHNDLLRKILAIP